ncbi:UNVERIFIED_CONTAM: hypothetical protein PYX00_010520 [Menopon gallinae]|uniref:tRNA N(3)-methylcytidine methyltransferase n=1 Tax=Menopon gallinae TaxID=328185 RepID=A0AAW2HG98_9NEOP
MDIKSDVAADGDERRQFRSRFLTEGESVFKHNAWDDFPWDDKQEAEAQKAVNANSKDKFSDCEREKYEKDAGKFWDDFYSKHQDKFFKDRHWLFVEFPELNVRNRTLENKINMLEIGCGVGNTIVPLLQSDLGQSMYIYGCDFSEKAISILREHPLYDESLCNAFVCDVTSDDWVVPFEKNSLDIVTMIFVLSAITPEKHSHVIRKIKEYLKPGGLILYRDYARFDMAQLRFKNGRCISDNFYARGDGTRVYFFTQEEVKNLFTNEGFVEEQNFIDRRLQVNRSKQLKMYRIWIIAKYRKPL